MLFFPEIIISHWNSNHFQPWMFLKWSKMCDSIYERFYSVVRRFKLIENSKSVVAWAQTFCMVRCTEITISYRNSNHFQSWMSLEQSKKYDSIYQFFYFVVRVFESTEKFIIANIASAVRSFNHRIERMTQPYLYKR